MLSLVPATDLPSCSLSAASPDQACIEIAIFVGFFFFNGYLLLRERGAERGDGIQSRLSADSPTWGSNS